MLCAVLGDPDLAQDSQPLEQSVVACEFWDNALSSYFVTQTVQYAPSGKICVKLAWNPLGTALLSHVVPEGWVGYYICSVVPWHWKNSDLLRCFVEEAKVGGKQLRNLIWHWVLGESFEDSDALQLRLMHAMPNTLRWEEVLDVTCRSCDSLNFGRGFQTYRDESASARGYLRISKIPNKSKV